MPLYLRVNNRKGQHTKLAWEETLVPKDEVYVGIDYKLVKKFVADHAHRAESMKVSINVYCDTTTLVEFNSFPVNEIDDDRVIVRSLPYIQWQTSLGNLRHLVKEFIK